MQNVLQRHRWIGLLLITIALPVFAEDLQTISGKTYVNYTVLKVLPDALQISHESGVSKVPLTDLPPAIREQYAEQARTAAEANAKARAAAAAQRSQIPNPEGASETQEHAERQGKLAEARNERFQQLSAEAKPYFTIDRTTFKKEGGGVLYADAGTIVLVSGKALLVDGMICSRASPELVPAYEYRAYKIQQIEILEREANAIPLEIEQKLVQIRTLEDSLAALKKTGVSMQDALPAVKDRQVQELKSNLKSVKAHVSSLLKEKATKSALISKAKAELECINQALEMLVSSRPDLQPVADPVKVEQDQSVPASGKPPVVGKPWTISDLKLEMLPVPSDGFRMGSTHGNANEKPVHQVLISKPYWMGKTEITQDQWQTIMGNNPSRFKGKTLPVARIPWNEAVAFCTKLTERERNNGRLPPGYVYRLPTEAEWEYAARGGNKNRGCLYSGSNNLDKVAWHPGNSGAASGGNMHPVGQKDENELGICDMSGNVQEWCHDWYAPYASGKVKDPTGPSRGSTRIFRGGSGLKVRRNIANKVADECRVTNRPQVTTSSPNNDIDDIGFRVSLAPELPTQPGSAQGGKNALKDMR
jgi:formylglycine-generating enzyme required for sulfatase activity